MRALHLISDVGSQFDLCGSNGVIEAGVQGDGERSTAQYSRDV
jgi:hypothetical protein